MISYANKLKSHDGKEEYITHIYPSRMQVKMCGDDPVIKVNVRLPKDGEAPTHWAWRDTGTQGWG